MQIIEPFDNTIKRLQKLSIIITNEKDIENIKNNEKILIFICNSDIIKNKYYIDILTFYNDHDYKNYCILNEKNIDWCINKILMYDFKDMIIYNCLNINLDYDFKNRCALIINENLNENIEYDFDNICVINNVLMYNNNIKSEKIFSYYLSLYFDNCLNNLINIINLKISKFNRHIIIYNKCNRKQLYM